MVMAQVGGEVVNYKQYNFGIVVWDVLLQYPWEIQMQDSNLVEPYCFVDSLEQLEAPAGLAKRLAIHEGEAEVQTSLEKAKSN